MKLKLTFNGALERIGDDYSVYASDVQAKALARKVWRVEWHMPGCLSESSTLCLTKADAIDQAIRFTGADGSDAVNHAVRGIRTALNRDGQFQHHTEMFGMVTTTINRTCLADHLEYAS